MPQGADNYLFTLTLKNTQTGVETEYAVEDSVAQEIANAMAERIDALDESAGTVITGLEFTSSTGVLKLAKQGATAGSTEYVGDPVTLPCASYKARMDAIDAKLDQYEDLING